MEGVPVGLLLGDAEGAIVGLVVLKAGGAAERASNAMYSGS
jgi:hypothetical protein